MSSRTGRPIERFVRGTIQRLCAGTTTPLALETAQPISSKSPYAGEAPEA
ncbi:MAG TPA: hypothetical protein VF103_06920 [Polyangiaceae bacterium]